MREIWTIPEDRQCAAAICCSCHDNVTQSNKKRIRPKRELEEGREENISHHHLRCMSPWVQLVDCPAFTTVTSAWAHTGWLTIYFCTVHRVIGGGDRRGKLGCQGGVGVVGGWGGEGDCSLNCCGVGGGRGESGVLIVCLLVAQSGLDKIARVQIFQLARTERNLKTGSHYLKRYFPIKPRVLLLLGLSVSWSVWPLTNIPNGQTVLKQLKRIIIVIFSNRGVKL